MQADSLPAEPRQVLLETVAGTLEELDLNVCGIMDAHVTAVLPALNHCSQLRVLSVCGNLVSMAVLQSLLCHNSWVACFRGTQELEWLDVRSAHHLALWQTLCCPFTTRAPHKSQQYLLIVFLPLYSTAEQMILNKGLLSPPQPRRSHPSPATGGWTGRLGLHA